MASFINCESAAVGGNLGDISLWNGRNATSGAAGSDPNTSIGGSGFITLDTLLKNITLRLNAAPGVGKDVNYRIKKNDVSPVNVTATQTISGAATTSVTNDVEATLPAVDGTSNTTIRNTMNWQNQWSSAAGVASTIAAYCYEYEVQGVGNARLSWYIIGSDFGNGSIGASEIYNPVVGITQFSSGNTVRGNQQIAWPVSGTFKKLAIVWKNLTASTSVNVALEANSTIGSGGDILGPYTLSSTSPTSNWQALTPSDTAAITAGQFVNWRMARNTGAATAIAIVICLGFEA